MVESSEADDQLRAELAPLIAADERWRVMARAGHTHVVRRWQDGTVDTVILLSPDTAYALREDPQGRRPWSMAGTRQQIIDHAQNLAAPGSPDAPPALGSDPPRDERR